MKKFVIKGIAIAILCVTMMAFACGCGNTATDEPTVEEIVEDCLRGIYKDITFDEIVIGETVINPRGYETVTIYIYQEGEIVGSIVVDTHWYDDNITQ